MRRAPFNRSCQLILQNNELPYPVQSSRDELKVSEARRGRSPPPAPSTRVNALAKAPAGMNDMLMSRAAADERQDD
jgi:hypothetical protein